MPELLYAQTAAGAAAGPGGAMGFLQGLFPLLLIFGAFYFLLIMPQNKERKKRDEMLKNIQRGDRVLTTGGIWGTVADIQENRLNVKIADNTRVEVERAYIQSVEKPA